MQPELSPEDTRCLIEYAMRKYAEERWPLSPELRQVREALMKLDRRPAPAPLLPAKPYVPSLAMQRKKKRR
jgi:hypothetical protein